MTPFAVRRTVTWPDRLQYLTHRRVRSCSSGECVRPPLTAMKRSYHAEAQMSLLETDLFALLEHTTDAAYSGDLLGILAAKR